jgi:hypothetical protein
MKYTNTLLTIIAACLIFQIAQSFAPKPIPVTVQTQEKTAAAPTGTLDVRVVAVSEPLKVDISSVGGSTLDEVEGRTVLPVGVRNTVETDIKGVDGHLSHVSGEGDGLPVAVLNR